MKKYNITKKCIIAMLLLLASGSNLFGQLIGWPTGAANLTVSTNQTWGDVRCKVIRSLSIGGGLYRLEFINGNSMSSILKDDYLCLIQMEGSLVGTHSMLRCSSSTATTITVSVPTGNLIPTSANFDLLENLQLVKIHHFKDLTINGGTITCPAYDHSTGTGGVLPIIVSGTFTLNGGFINVSGKGYKSYFSSGGSLGTPGTGLPFTTTGTNNNGVSGGRSGHVNTFTNTLYGPNYFDNSNGLIGDYDGPICATSNTITRQIYVGNSGEQGYDANNSTNFGTGTSGENLLTATPSYNGLLTLGSSGVSGNMSGSGAGSGGQSGRAGEIYNTSGNTLGNLQNDGKGGKDGGAPGYGGAGGGIIYLKVGNSTINSALGSSVRFFANGEQGQCGQDGGDGGIGGPPQKGPSGLCVNVLGTDEIHTPGGWGGGGEGGIGGGGGDGGSGGNGGCVWILKQSGGTHSSFTGKIMARKGFKGDGGVGGYQSTYLSTPRARNYINSSGNPELLVNLSCNNGDFEACDPLLYCPPQTCDCDKVFEHLGVTMNGSVSIVSPSAWSGATFDFVSTGSGIPRVHWDANDGVLFVVKNVNNCITRFDCRMNANSLYKIFMEKAGNTNGLSNANLLSYTSSTPTYSGIDETSNSTSGSNTKVQLKFNGHTVFEYEMGTEILTDVDDPTLPKVTGNRCNSNYFVASLGGGKGNNSGTGEGKGDPDDQVGVKQNITGTTGSNGSDGVDGDVQEDDANPQSIRPLDNGSNQSQQSTIQYNLKYSNQNLTFTSNEVSEVSIEIYTIDGKMLDTKKVSQNNYQITNVTPGIYLLKISKDGITKNLKFYID